jgi:hypothetical protein
MGFSSSASKLLKFYYINHSRPCLLAKTLYLCLCHPLPITITKCSGEEGFKLSHVL